MAKDVRTADLVEKLVTGDTWPRRRMVMFSALIFWGVTIAAILGFGLDTDVAKTVAVSFTCAMAATISTYVFGGVWDDNNKRRLIPPLDALASPTPAPAADDPAPFLGPADDTPALPAPAPFVSPPVPLATTTEPELVVPAMPLSRVSVPSVTPPPLSILPSLPRT